MVTKSSPHPDVASALAALQGRETDHVFFVACGGSLSIMYPAKFMLDQASASLPSDLYNAAEFTHRAPKRLTSDSLVILCSMTGTTKETVAAAAFAREAGALTISLTVEPESPLAKASDHVVSFEAPYTTGIPIDAKNSNYARIYQIVQGLAARYDGVDRMSALMDSLNALQGVIDNAQTVFAPRFDEYAPHFAKQDVVYTMASGASYGAAYSYAICVLMEMQWINSHPIHANEFFHGAFEVLDEERCYILMKGLDDTRPLEERAEEFLLRFGRKENILVVDAAEVDFTGVAEEFRGAFAPLMFFDTLWKFAYRLAGLRDHKMMEARRYMKKLNDY
ncbi:SIS domain-containing protein [Yoonia sp. MH D7]